MGTAATLDRFDGIILRTYPYAEADLVLRVLSPDGGKRSLIAKHARREKSRFRVNFDVFDAGAFEVKAGKGSLETLVDFNPHRSLAGIRNDIDSFIIGMLILESCDLLIHEHAPEAQEFYETLALGLRALDEASDLREKFRACFLTLHTILRIAGFGSSAHEAPSLKNLYALMDSIEQSCEKQLATRADMTALLHRWSTRESGLRSSE